VMYIGQPSGDVLYGRPPRVVDIVVRNKNETLTPAVICHFAMLRNYNVRFCACLLLLRKTHGVK